MNFVQGRKMVCSVNHAPQGLEMCARVKFVCSVNHTRHGLRKHGCKYISDLSTVKNMF